jgi:penicillin-binding protein 1A
MERSEKAARPAGKKRGRALKTLKTLAIGAALCAALLGSVVVGALVGFMDNSSDLIAQEYNIDFTSVMYYTDENGRDVELSKLYAEQNRIWVDLENPPPYLRDAFVAIEDERFDAHKGVDWKRTLGAVLNYVVKSQSTYGGSTITQQVIKNVTGDDDVTPIRKIQEIVRALNLETKMSKDQIIEMYMNIIYLGQGCNGVQAASNVYFSKDVNKLSLAECASLAGITQEPARYDPFINFEAHKAKQELVLDKMEELGYISAEECAAAKAEKLALKKGVAPASAGHIQ